MTRTVVASVFLCIALTLSADAQRSTPARQAEAALGAAIHQDEVEGNLQAAIAAYKNVLSRFGSNRKVAAEAQYRLGLAYESLGDAQARQAYERVVREFADQKDVATDAGRRLAAISVPRSADGLVPRLVFAGETDRRAIHFAVSDDGRWLALRGVSPYDGNLIVRDTTTGEVRRLPTGSCFGIMECIAERPVFSRDGRQIAYRWAEGKQDASGNHAGSLRVIGNDALATPRVLLQIRETDLAPLAWSPDGRSILTWMYPFNTPAQFAWVSVSDGTVAVIKRLQERRLEPGWLPQLSPDGKFIAYAATPRESGQPVANLGASQIYVLAADGSSEEQITRESNNGKPVWTPDGSHLVFVSTREGSNSLWAVPMRNGHAAGNVALLKRDFAPIWSMKMTRAGSLYYTQNQSVNEVWAIDNLMSALKTAR